MAGPAGAVGSSGPGGAGRTTGGGVPTTDGFPCEGSPSNGVPGWEGGCWPNGVAGPTISGAIISEHGMAVP